MKRSSIPMIAALIPLCGISPSASRATAVETAGATGCSISGWSDDRDPAGLNVRAAPRKDAPLVGRIPPETMPPKNMKGRDTNAAEFDIVGSRNGWFLIRDAKFVDYGGGSDGVVFRGLGWVYADKVRFLINNIDLHSAADRDSPVVMKLVSPDHTAGPDSANIDHVYGCHGDFVDILVHMEGPTARGWATGICSNQVTTCP